jgi:hypothetical protein
MELHVYVTESRGAQHLCIKTDFRHGGYNLMHFTYMSCDHRGRKLEYAGPDRGLAQLSWIRGSRGEGIISVL